MAVINFIENRRGIVNKGLEIDTSMFKVTRGFAVGALVIVGLLVPCILSIGRSVGGLFTAIFFAYKNCF